MKQSEGDTSDNTAGDKASNQVVDHAAEDLAKLDRLKKNIAEAKAQKQAHLADAGESPQIGRAMHVATELLAATGVGGVLGFMIDRWVGSSPFALIIGVFLGFAAGIRIMLKHYVSSSESDNI